jgi:hypothetical protein
VECIDHPTGSTRHVVKWLRTSTGAEKEQTVTKGNKRQGNRETKKPKKPKEKIVATSDFTKGRSENLLGERKK